MPQCERLTLLHAMSAGPFHCEQEVLFSRMTRTFKSLHYFGL